MPIPPAAAERLKQRRRIGEPRRAGLHHLNHRLLIGLLGVEQQQDVGVAGFHLLAGEVETHLRSAFEVARGLQRIRVVLQGAQRVGDVLHGGDDGAPVSPGRRVVSVLGLLELVQKRAAVKQCLGNITRNLPKQVLR